MHIFAFRAQSLKGLKAKIENFLGIYSLRDAIITDLL